MKSGSSSAVAFGRVLQAVRRRVSKNQAEVAGYFSPKLSVAAVSMAESGNRPPKTEAAVRSFAAALELDDDDLVELWWAMQGMVEIDDRTSERTVRQWWRRLHPSPQVEIDHFHATERAKRSWTPNEDTYAPSLELFALSQAICDILKRLLGETWEVRPSAETGLREPIDGRLAAITIELREGGPPNVGSGESRELLTTFPCPEPLTRPVPPEASTRPSADGLPPDVAWILASVEAMPARERAAVAGFIHGLREGSLFSETVPPYKRAASPRRVPADGT